MTKRDLSRRSFLKRMSGSAAGLALMTSLPAWVFSSKRHSRAYVERSFFTMGSVATISAFDDDRRHMMHAVTRAIEEFQRIENALSIFIPSSQVSRVNAEAGRNEVQAEGDLLWIADWSSKMSPLTKGAFDITVGPLMELWGFRGNHVDAEPDDKRILQLLGAVGSDKILVNNNAATVGLTHPAARIDLGGVGVGYAIDRAVQILRSEGVESAFVNHSGDAYALGTPDEHEGWEIGIPDPGSPDNILEKLTVRDGAIATSGGYRQFVTIGPRRFAHIIDPRSGIPGRSFVSTSVLAPDAVTADALSTSMFCSGPDEVKEVLDHFPKTSLIELSREGNEPITRMRNIKGRTSDG